MTRVHKSGVRDPSRALCGTVSSRELKLTTVDASVTCMNCRGWAEWAAAQEKKT